jgi:hypothetical protein
MTVEDADFLPRYHQAYPDEPAINAHHMMRIVLDTCSTVDEAIRLVSGFRCWFPSEWLHFMVSDASGGKAVFEFDAQGRLLTVRPEPGKGYLLSTNSYMTADRSRPGFDPFDTRFGRGTKMLDGASLASVDDLRAIIMRLAGSPSNPELPPAVKLARNQTRWQDFYDLDRRTLRLYVSGTGLRVPYDFSVSKDTGG